MLSSLPLPIAAFVAGLISFLSPCVLPLVPGYVSMISGAGVDELQEQDAKLRRTVLLNSLMFIVGFSIVFIMLGAAASGVGRILGHNRTLLLRVAGIVIILFGLHLTGILPIKYLYADKRLHDVKTKATAAGAFLVGFAFAFGWTPCIGPILATILTFAAEQATVLKGVLLLAVYSLGLAVPFLLTSLAISQFLGFYTRFRKHLHTVEVISGVLMIAIGFMIFFHKFAYLAAWLNKVPFFRVISERFL
jgi:cytochrome c-type biogenesis protein